MAEAASRPLPTVSFVVTALNEERHVEATAATIRAAAEGILADWEVVLVDDGSTDRTGEIMDRLAAADPRLRVVHNPRNLGLGGAYKRGLAAARLEHVMWVSGDNAETAENLRNILRHVGEADIVIPVLVDQENRPWLRRLTSRTFVLVVNLLFGLRVRYYNGAVVHRRALIQGIEIVTDSFAYQAEALIKLLRAGRSFVEVEYQSASYSGIISYAMRPKNLARVVGTLLRLFWTERLGGRRAS
jgi:glycosyltransferase involved in cell wall biosynthesis